MHMSATAKYEITQEDGRICVHAKGKTRAGLFTSAMHGLFAAMKPQHHEGEAPKNERSFSVEAESAEALLVKMLNEALEVSTERKETCDELKLSLITDKKVEGSFVGCEVTLFDQPIASATDHGLTVSKNEETGEWEATICFQQ